MSDRIDLNSLLPIIYRLRDDERGGQLRALLELISSQAEIIKEDIDDLWDDFFIETCDDWVIPYIGDLVGTSPLHEVAIGRRADVARTIHYRRRKGTLPMLEDLAGDVTGWGAHVVPFFELLVWTQNLNHLRCDAAPNPENRDPNSFSRVGTVNLRHVDALDRLDSPFDIISHSVDVRAIEQFRGWHNIRKAGFFIWRLQSYPLKEVTARQASGPHGYGYHFDPLGSPTHLFGRPKGQNNEIPSESRAGALRGLDGRNTVEEAHLPGAIRPAAFYFDLENFRKTYSSTAKDIRPTSSSYYGPECNLCIIKDLSIIKNGQPEDIAPSDVICKDLSNWGRPPKGMVAVDVRLGRIAFAENEEPGAPERVRVSYNYGFSADMGGGPYDRLQTLEDPTSKSWSKTVAQDKNGNFKSLSDAIADWESSAKKDDGLITILDSATYREELSLHIAENCRLVIAAENRTRPHLLGSLTITGGHRDAAVKLNGLLIEGGIEVKGMLGGLEIVHCTLVPTKDCISIKVGEANDCLQLTVDSSIIGQIRMPSEARSLSVKDSIVDAFGGLAISGITDQQVNDLPGPPVKIERATIMGSLLVNEMELASDSIFTAQVLVQRQQIGCMRFCCLPDKASKTPRRYRCQPDLALENVTYSKEAQVRERLVPSFTSVQHGQPGYAQLGHLCPREIRTGAEDGSEMGAFCQQKQPQREANLRIRLEEYLPFGLEAGLIYVT
jgi:hypothetical protein